MLFTRISQNTSAQGDWNEKIHTEIVKESPEEMVSPLDKIDFKAKSIIWDKVSLEKKKKSHFIITVLIHGEMI